MVSARDRIAQVSFKNYRDSAISCIFMRRSETRNSIDFVHVAIDSVNTSEYDEIQMLFRKILTEKQKVIEIRLPVRYR